MKRKLIKNLSATALMLSIYVQGLVPASAAAVSSFPWVKNYDNLSEMTITESIDPHHKSGLDLRFFAKDDRLSVVKDDDPEHGMVVKHKRLDTTERFLDLWIAEQKSGKLLYSFDVKSKRKSGFTFTTRPKKDNGWNPSLQMRDGEFKLGGGVTLAYEQNKWYRVDILLDLDELVATCFVEGKSGRTPFAGGNTSIEALGFHFLTTDAVETEEEDGLYFDNMSFVKFDTDGAKISLTSDEKEVGTSYDGSGVFKMSIQNDSFTDSMNGIAMTDMGANPIEAEPVNVPIKVSVNGSELSLVPQIPLNDGHNYKIEIPTDAKTIFGQNFSQTVFEFTKSAPGKAQIDEESDFSGITALPDAEADLLIGNNQKLFFATGMGKYEIVEDETFTDKKGIKLNHRAAVYMNFPAKTALKSGIIKFEVKYKVLEGSAYLYYGNEDVPKMTLIHSTPTQTEVTRQSPLGTSGRPMIYDTWTAPENGFVTATYEINLDKRAIPEFVVNGKLGTISEGDMPFYENDENVMDKGIRFLRFEAARDSTMIVDYVKCSYVYDAPTLRNVVFKGENGTFTYNKGDKLSPQTEQIIIGFSEAVASDTAKNITIIGSNGEKVPYSGKAENDEYIITLTNYLAEKTDYTITVPRTVTSSIGAPIANEVVGKISTGEGKFEISPIRITDEGGNIVSDMSFEGNNIKIEADIINTNASVKDFALVFAGRKNLTLKGMTYAEFSLDENDRKVKLSLPVTVKNKSELTSISGYLWNSMQNNMPRAEVTAVK